MTQISGSTYPNPFGPNTPPLINLGGLTGHPDTVSPAEFVADDPSARNGAVLEMMQRWRTININVGGTNLVRQHADEIIPREPKEPDDAYRRRIFHAVMPPFLQRLASQAAGTILRRGVHLEGGDEEYWKAWADDVTGEARLNSFAASCWSTRSMAGWPGRHSADEQPSAWRRVGASCLIWCAFSRFALHGGEPSPRPWRPHEVVSEPKGAFGESLVDQIRVITPDGYQIWRSGTGNGQQQNWDLYEAGQHTAGEIPLVAVYSNRVATLVSKPPLEECGNLAIAYCQRFTDYMHNVHCGALPSCPGG